MDMLSIDTLLDALIRCDKYTDVEVCIALKNLWNTQELTDSLYNEIRGNRLGNWKINRGITRGKATLKSACGSHIHILNIQSPELFRGKHFHWVLFENGITDDAFEALSYTECLNAPWEQMPDSAELDNFLNGFKIIPNSCFIYGGL